MKFCKMKMVQIVCTTQITQKWKIQHQEIPAKLGCMAKHPRQESAPLKAMLASATESFLLQNRHGRRSVSFVSPSQYSPSPLFSRSTFSLVVSFKVYHEAHCSKYVESGNYGQPKSIPSRRAAPSLQTFNETFTPSSTNTFLCWT